MTGDRQARCGRSGGGRVAGGSATGAGVGVGHGQVEGGTGVCCRHGQAVQADGRVLQAREQHGCASGGRTRLGRRGRAASTLDDRRVLQARQGGTSDGDGCGKRRSVGRACARHGCRRRVSAGGGHR